MLTVGLDIITPRLVLGKMNLQIAGNIKVNHSKSSSITYHRSKPYYHYLSIRIFTNLTWHVELLYHPVCALAYRSWFQLQMISQDHVRIQMSNISPYASTASNFSPMVNETNQSPTFVLFMYTLILLILKQPAKKGGKQMFLIWNQLCTFYPCITYCTFHPQSDCVELVPDDSPYSLPTTGMHQNNNFFVYVVDDLNLSVSNTDLKHECKMSVMFHLVTHHRSWSTRKYVSAPVYLHLYIYIYVYAN